MVYHLCPGGGRVFFFDQKDISRLFMGTTAVALLAGTLALRALLRFAGARKWSRNPARLLIVGSDIVAQRAAVRLRRAKSRISAFDRVRSSSRPEDQRARRARLSTGRTREVAPRYRRIVIALPLDLSGRIPRIRRQLESRCRPIRAILDLGMFEPNDRMFQFGGLHMLDLAATPAETPSYNLLKSSF